MEQQTIRINLIVATIVVAQFFCISVWFASNAVVEDLCSHFNLPASYTAHLTTLVQLGFITGTLVFTLFSIADRMKPKWLYFGSALLAALFNYSIVFELDNTNFILLFRFLTGFFLAGIYPVGMKIAADYFEKSLGKTLSLIVSALALGTALPHLIKYLGIGLDWEGVFTATSVLAVTGGGMMLFIKDGPFRKKAQNIQLKETVKLFRNNQFKLGSFGYFGHMWELYALWVFIPVILSQYLEFHNVYDFNVSLWSFLIIGLGVIGCIVGGRIAHNRGASKVAFDSLHLSLICCLLFPFVFYSSPMLFIPFMVFWGIVVIADSALFSSLIANSVSGELKGTALTVSTCIGFGVTIVSIQFVGILNSYFSNPIVYVIMALGPIVAIIYSRFFNR